MNDATYLFTIATDRRGINLLNTEPESDEVFIDAHPLGQGEQEDAAAVRADLIARGWQDTGEPWAYEQIHEVTYITGKARRIAAPAIPVPMAVGSVGTLLTLTTTEGVQVSVHRTEQGATAALYRYVVEQIEEHVEGHPLIPTDPQEAIRLFFKANSEDKYVMKTITVTD